MSRVIMMCGPAGSGKSTYAKRLEEQGMVRLSFDVEAWKRGITAMPVAPEIRTEIEAELQRQLLSLIAEERDVVLDRSFHSREMRNRYRQWLAPLGIVPETHYLATSRETVLQRLADRRGGHADDYVLSGELAAQYYDGFEVPTPEEGPLVVIES